MAEKASACPATAAPPVCFVVSCEHAARGVPPEHAHLFADEPGVLDSHRGYDRGALDLARHLATALGAPLLWCGTTRLVVDCNRSEDNPQVFSRRTRSLDAAAREGLLATVHRPHRERVRRAVADALARAGGRPVLHLACHSFTPIWKGRERDVDVGLLYDPKREAETAFCRAWQRGLATAAPGLRVRRNRPYRGWTDGLCTTLRNEFPATYLGVELEISQALEPGTLWGPLMAGLTVS